MVLQGHIKLTYFKHRVILSDVKRLAMKWRKYEYVAIPRPHYNPILQKGVL